jgi:hypothetical protein
MPQERFQRTTKFMQVSQAPCQSSTDVNRPYRPTEAAYLATPHTGTSQPAAGEQIGSEVKTKPCDPGPVDNCATGHHTGRLSANPARPAGSRRWPWWHEVLCPQPPSHALQAASTLAHSDR